MHVQLQSCSKKNDERPKKRTYSSQVSKICPKDSAEQHDVIGNFYFKFRVLRLLFQQNSFSLFSLFFVSSDPGVYNRSA